MKITELSISNYFSFCKNGLNADNNIKLSDFNLFIGRNNAGKSNVLKLINLIRTILFSFYQSGNPTLHQFPLSLGAQEDISHFKDHYFELNQNARIDFSFSTEIEQSEGAQLNISATDYQYPNALLFMFECKNKWPKNIKVSGYIEYTIDRVQVTISKVEIPNDHNIFGNQPILFDRENRQILIPIHDDHIRTPAYQNFKTDNQGDWDRNFSATAQYIYDFLRKLYDTIFKNLIINIPPYREMKTGHETINDLAGLRDQRPEERAIFEKVIEMLEELIFTEEGRNIGLYFPTDAKSKSRNIEIAADKLQLPISSWGDGVQQVLFLASEITKKGANKLILIEEPEAHLHPALQRKFIRFLKKNEGVFGHQYFITSHSSIFIDEFLNIRQNIFHVYQDKSETIPTNYSQIELINRDYEQLPTLLKDLGVKPSDILMSNGVLVVEGPTDKDIYSHWAQKLGMPFEEICLQVIDVKGAGNISKYLSSSVIQRTCFMKYAICDKNAEFEIKKKLEGIVPDNDIIVLHNGDLEDYYPRDLVLAFLKYWAQKKGVNNEIPSAIDDGATVKTLDGLLGGDWWKRKLADEMLEKMDRDQIHTEITDIITKIYNSMDY